MIEDYIPTEEFVPAYGLAYAIATVVGVVLTVAITVWMFL